jgi:hypothetical protein
VPELNGLVDRLRARATSTLFPDQPLLKSEIALAAAALRALVRNMKPEDRLEINGD